MVDTKVARRTEQPLRKQRAQPPFGSQQQPVHTAEPNRHRAQRIPFKTKPKTTWKNGLQLVQAGLKPVQERGLCYQGIDELGFSAPSIRDGVWINYVCAGEGWRSRRNVMHGVLMLLLQNRIDVMII
jgi:hypothetical protein